MTAALSILYANETNDKTLSVKRELISFIVFCFNLFMVGFFLNANYALFEINPSAYSKEILNMEKIKAEIENNSSAWIEAKTAKYSRYKLSYPVSGIIHAKGLAPVNGSSVRVNVLEINAKINPSLEIKPQTASNTLNSRVKIKTTAEKTGAIAAINGGYFKPQTGVPLGALVIDNEVLTGPIYERAGFSINKDGSYSTGKTNITFSLKNENIDFKIDNINQPRMLSTYTLLYTDKWGKISPPPPKYGSVALILNGEITKISKTAFEIPKGGYIISAPDSEINKIKNEKKLKFITHYPKHFENAVHIVSGGPYLLKEGEIYIDVKEEKLSSITGRNPRTLIGYTKENDLILVTVDGREASSIGMSLYEAAKYMQKLGCFEAINLDGGSSSVMYVNGKITNSPPVTGGIPISGIITITSNEKISKL